MHNTQAANGRIGLLDRADHFPINVRCFSDPLCHGSVASERAFVEQAVTTELADDSRNATDLVQVLDME